MNLDFVLYLCSRWFGRWANSRIFETIMPYWQIFILAL